MRRLEEGPVPCPVQHNHYGGILKSGGFLWLQEMWYDGSIEGADGGTVYTDNRAGIYAYDG